MLGPVSRVRRRTTGVGQSRDCRRACKRWRGRSGQAGRPGRRSGAPAAGDLLLQLDHPQVALSLIVRGRDAQVDQEPADLGAIAVQPLQRQAAGERLARRRPASAGRAGWGGVAAWPLALNWLQRPGRSSTARVAASCGSTSTTTPAAQRPRAHRPPRRLDPGRGRQRSAYHPPQRQPHRGALALSARRDRRGRPGDRHRPGHPRPGHLVERSGPSSATIGACASPAERWWCPI